MAVLKKKLSGSTDGRNVVVVATASAGTTIHTAVASTNANTWDLITLVAYNTSASPVKLTVDPLSEQTELEAASIVIVTGRPDVDVTATL